MSAVFANLSLFSDYFLKERLPDSKTWEEDVTDAFEELREIYQSEKDDLESANEAQRPSPNFCVTPLSVRRSSVSFSS